MAFGSASAVGRIGMLRPCFVQACAFGLVSAAGRGGMLRPARCGSTAACAEVRPQVRTECGIERKQDLGRGRCRARCPLLGVTERKRYQNGQQSTIRRLPEAAGKRQQRDGKNIQ